MSHPIIKLYSPNSRLSSISDEVIDSRKSSNLFFEFRDNITLCQNSMYQVLISSDREIKGNYEFEYKNSNMVEIKILNENQILSRTSKNPFTAKLVDKNNNTIGLGIFYRYRTTASERSINPAKWDPKFSPLEHINYTGICKSGLKSNSIFSNSPQSTKSQNLFPTPDPSESDISLYSIPSLKYSSNSSKNKINHSTPTPSFVSNSHTKLNLFTKQNFLTKKFNNKKIETTIAASSYLTDDSSDDDDYSFANRTNLSNVFDSQSQLFLDSKSYLDLFDSIESVSQIVSPIKNNQNFFSFTLLFSLNNSEANYTKIKENVFIANLEKNFVSNHAVRKLCQIYKIKLLASFKIEINATKAKLFENDLINLLLNGIQVEINGKIEKFFYIGNSNSGMRERNFWAIDEKSFKSLNFESFLFKMGEFKQFSSIAKLSKRFSQCFSSSLPSITLEKDEFCVIKDELSCDNLCFSDGIGLMRLELCEKISKILELDYHSMIFQIRCAGFKGMLVGFPDKVFNSLLEANNLPISNKIKILFRVSQQKFNSHSLELNILSWSSFDSSPASLNSEFLMVLDGLSKTPTIKNYIISLFQDCLTDFDESLIDPKKAFVKLFNSSEISEFSHKYKTILMACRKNLVKELDQKQYKIIRNLLIEQYLFSLITKKKINVQIEKSRYLIGILDETGNLNEDEVFVSYRDQSGKIQFLNEQMCLVGRNPCYSLSEIRKVKTKFLPTLQHLENCIVFPKKGKRPLPNILSGGDLDGDFYFVSWDEVLTSNIENSDNLINYPKSQDFSSFVMNKNLWNQLVEFYAKQVINENGIGLWHYYLTCMYDEDRKNMTEKCYLDAVLEINRVIDGHSTGCGQIKKIRKPDWYLSSQELISLNGNNKEDKFRALYEILEKKMLNLDKTELDTNRYSLLGCLATIAIKKYLNLISDMEIKTNGQFLKDDEIDILAKNKKINLNICSDSIKSENLKMIKQEYKNFVSEFTKLNEIIKNDTSREIKLFTGLYEKQIKKETVTNKEQLKIGLINKFREFVVNLKYSNEDITDENYKNSVFCLDGYYFRSRVVNLYLDLKDEEFYYQIPWMFYDVLCYLKNYCNDKKSPKVVLALPDLIPFSLATECTHTFSPKKLSNFEKFF